MHDTRRDLHAFFAILLAVVLALSGCDGDGSNNGNNDTGGNNDASDDVSGGDDTTTQDTNTPPDTNVAIDTTPPDTGPPPDVPPRLRDQDSDTILDGDEDEPTQVDTDSDGTPDYLDKDTDGDGIPDLSEAGDIDIHTPPVDSDGDGTPDFRDTDSDDNGIPDAIEGALDTDGDGTPDFADRDNDGDNASDADEMLGPSGVDCDGDGQPDPQGTPDNPFDCNGDGTPDHMSVDADGDGILDRFEGDINRDTDSDGTPDRFDSDSDNDGIPDSVEQALDPDQDTVPNQRDLDSDADGISDTDEFNNGTDPYSADSDGDGANDLIEVTAGTNPNFDGDSPLLNGDFVFVVPYSAAGTAPPVPLVEILTFQTNFQLADVFFLFDRTGSMLAEVNAMRGAITNIINNFTCGQSIASCTRDIDCAPSEVCGAAGNCLENPAIRGCIPSFFTGVGVYGGDPASNPFATLQPIGSDGDATASALPASVGNYGTQEAMFAAVECTADPASCDAGWTAGCAGSGIGCPGYRQDSVRIFVLITDEDNEFVDNSFTATTAATALTDNGIRFVGIEAANGGTGNGDADLKAIATAAGSLDSNGQPLVRAGDGLSIVPRVTDAISEIVNTIPTTVTIEISGPPEATRFLDYLEVNISNDDLDGDGIIDCEAVSTTSDTIPVGALDGFNDAFNDIQPGTRVCWDVHPKFNDFAEARADAQLFQMTLTVRDDTGAILDTRDVFFLVPPRPFIFN